MKKIYRLVIFCLGLSVQVFAGTFTVINQTDIRLRITWKSNSLGPGRKLGIFEIAPGARCNSCLETYKNNCVHYLLAESIDKKYKAWSKQFCNDSRIIITSNKNKLAISIEPINLSGVSI